MRFGRLAQFVVLSAVVLTSVPCLGQVSDKAGAPADFRLEVGRHYRVVVKEMEGDEAVTTIYWATVKQVGEENITMADGEWAQSTGPVAKPRAMIFINRLSSTIERLLGREPGRLGGLPVGDEIVAMPRSRIMHVSAISKAEYREKEAHRPALPRPPHALVRNGT